MANDAPAMNPLERVAAVENTFTSGDSYVAQNLLNNVSNQQAFMDRLANVAQNDNLPGLQISYDNDHHAHQIKTDRLTVSDTDGHLTAHANHWKDSIASGASAAANAVEGYFSAPPEPGSLRDCLATSGTVNSCADRKMAKEMKDGGAD
jgi:hypothetical protein